MIAEEDIINFSFVVSAFIFSIYQIVNIIMLPSFSVGLFFSCEQIKDVCNRPINLNRFNNSFTDCMLYYDVSDCLNEDNELNTMFADYDLYGCSRVWIVLPNGSKQFIFKSEGCE